MSTSQLRELVEAGGLVGLTVEQYHQMIEAGILPEGEPIELLDGFLVRKDRAKAGEDPMTVGTDHTWALQNVVDLLSEPLRGWGCYVRVQQPVTLPPDGEPEPDAAIARGSKDDYRQGHPGADNVPCVIEVSDSSLQKDRVTKKRIYAEGGVMQYVIINLADRQLEVYQQPVPKEGRYAREAVLKGNDIVRFSAAQGREVPVGADQLLPRKPN